MSSRSRLRHALPAAMLAGVLCTDVQAEPLDLSFGVASATVLRGVALGDPLVFRYDGMVRRSGKGGVHDVLLGFNSHNV